MPCRAPGNRMTPSTSALQAPAQGGRSQGLPQPCARASSGHLCGSGSQPADPHWFQPSQLPSGLWCPPLCPSSPGDCSHLRHPAGRPRSPSLHGKAEVCAEAICLCPAHKEGFRLCGLRVPWSWPQRCSGALWPVSIQELCRACGAERGAPPRGAVTGTDAISPGLEPTAGPHRQQRPACPAGSLFRQLGRGRG